MQVIKKSLHKIMHAFRSKAMILMYHKIGSPFYDPWDLSVSAENFEAQLYVLKNYPVLPIDEIVDQILRKKLKHKCVGLTFDDGYLDNYTTAWPLLTSYNLPSTIFITTKNIDSEKEFWWDELEFILLQIEELPSILTFELKKEHFYFELKNENKLTESIIEKQKRYKADKTVSLRTELYFKLWQVFSKLKHQEQELLMQKIREWTGVDIISRKENLCMNKEQLKEISLDQLIAIGGHTTNHPTLSSLNAAQQCNEIKENKEFLETITGKQVPYFAYPSGNYDPNAIECVKKAGFQAAFTTNHKLNFTNSDLYKLNRFQVNDWDANQFEKKLQQWSHF